MGGLFKPQVTTFDPTSKAAGNVQNQLLPFIQQFMKNPQAFGQQFNSPMNDPVNAAFMNAIGGPQNPMGLAGQTVASMQPIFQRNLNDSMTALSNRAPGRYSSALAMEGTDLASRANQDFNVFMNQAMQQGLGQHINLLGQASQTANQQTQLAQNPVLAMLQNVFGFAQPQGKQAIVGNSPIGQIADIGLSGAGLITSGIFGGKKAGT
jgi:hypothetical protein